MFEDTCVWKDPRRSVNESVGAEKDEWAKWMLMDFALIIKVQNILFILKSQTELRSHYLVLKGEHLSIYLFQVTSAITFITILFYGTPRSSSTTIDCQQSLVPSKLLCSRDVLKSTGKAFLGLCPMWQCIHSWLNNRRMLYLHTVSHDQDDYKLQAATAR